MNARIWRSSERLADEGYTDVVQRDAFRAGYSDGFHNYPRVPNDWPHRIYNAAYAGGRHDREAEE